MNLPPLRPARPSPFCRTALVWALAWPAAFLAQAHAQAPGLPAAAALPAPAIAQALALLREAAATQAPDGARVQAEAGQADPRLRLAPCARVEPFLVPGTRPWGRTRVGLRCTEGVTRWTVYLPATVQVWAPAVVPAAALPAGARLESPQLHVAEVDWAAAPQPPFASVEALAGRVLARAVLPGQPLRAPDLQARQWFAAGDPVRVLAQGPGFAISADGQATSAGIEGQRVRVRIGENRVVEGRAVGHRLVEVGP